MNLEALQADLTGAIANIGQDIWQRGQQLSQLAVNHKAPGDVATDIDLWAERALKAKLQTLLPQAGFMGEETGGQLSDAPTWVVDPIDGTANFARGYPQWSVSVALAVNQQPVLGVIADPNRQETFYAAQGQGAWLRNRDGVQRLQAARPREALQATVSTVFPKPKAVFMEAYLQEFAQVIRQFGQVRRSGSMALELAYVAAGRADAFWERGMQAWDAAAGMVLLQEAGAQIVALDDLPILQSQMLAAGSPHALLQLLKLLHY